MGRYVSLYYEKKYIHIIAILHFSHFIMAINDKLD